MVAIASLCALLLIAVGAGVGAGLGAGIGTRLAHRDATSSHSAAAPIRIVPQITSTPGSGTAGATDPQAIAQRVEPAIVDIQTVVDSGGQSGQAAGTGMILTPGGEILTNNHVIAGATRISVTLPAQNRTYLASVVGTNPGADVALLQVQGVSGLPVVTVADSSTVTVGEPVVAIGNAFGRGGTPSVTSGSVTALDQNITASDGTGPGEQLTGLIQEDAAISPGDSGGALVNNAGQVIGMITAGEQNGFRRRGGTTTVGYAIPSNNAIAVINQIHSGAASGTVTPAPAAAAYLGVQVTDVDAATARRLGLSGTGGAHVLQVIGGSPAEAAGITPDSVITSFDGHALAGSQSLGGLIHALKPGTKVPVTWVDGSGSHTRSVALG